MEKKISDEELDRLLEEQFLNEADAIEDAIFSDDFEEYERRNGRGSGCGLRRTGISS